MQCAGRSPLSPPRQAETPRVILGAQAWRALLRTQPAIDAGARVVEASIAHLGASGIDRYELEVRIVESNGMFDDRIWLLERDELQALVAALGDDVQAHALARLMSTRPRPAS